MPTPTPMPMPIRAHALGLLALLAEGLASGARRTELAREAIELADASPRSGAAGSHSAHRCCTRCGARTGTRRGVRADVAWRAINRGPRAAGDPAPGVSRSTAAAYHGRDPAGRPRPGPRASLQRLHAIAGPGRRPGHALDGRILRPRSSRRCRPASPTPGSWPGRAWKPASPWEPPTSSPSLPGRPAVLAAIAGHRLRAGRRPSAQAVEAGPVELTSRLAHAIVSVAGDPRGPQGGRPAMSSMKRVRRRLPARTPGPDVGNFHARLPPPWRSSSRTSAPPRSSLAIIEPYTGEIATKPGPRSPPTAGRLASLLGRHGTRRAAPDGPHSGSPTPSTGTTTGPRS